MNLNTTKFLTIITFIITIFGCTKEKYSGQYPLSDELKFLLPSSNTYQYYNNDSVLNVISLSFTDFYYFKDNWDSDDGGLGRDIAYTGDFEVNVKNYTSELFNINYRIFVDKYGDLQQDVLDITLESNLSGENTGIHIEMPLEDFRDRGYEPNINFADSLMINNVKLFDVYFIESDGLLYYLQEEKGLVAFEFDDDFWMLNK